MKEWNTKGETTMFEYSVQFLMNGSYGVCYTCFGKTKESALSGLLRRAGYPYGASNILRVRDHQEACYWVSSKRKDRHSKRQWLKISKDWIDEQEDHCKRANLDVSYKNSM